MKKSLLGWMMAVAIIATGCSKNEVDTKEPEALEPEPVIVEEKVETPQEQVSINILVPHGSTAMALSHMNFERPELLPNVLYEFEDYVQGSDPLLTAFTSESSNVIVAPTNLGATLYQKGVPYKLAATIGWGNLYLIADEEMSFEDLAGKTITAFGQGSTPDIVLQTILKEKGLTDSVEIVYLNSVADVQAMYAAGEAPIVVIAEPSLTVLKSKVENVNLVMDFQEAWGEVYGVSSYPQASLFVHNDLIENQPEAVDALLREVQASIEFANTTPEEMAKQAIESGLEMPEPVIAASTKTSNLQYKSASDAQAEIQIYLEKLFEFEPKTIGGQLPDDNFFLLP